MCFWVPVDWATLTGEHLQYLGELQGKSVCTKMSSSRDSTMESAADVVRRAVLWWNSVIVRYLTSLPLREDGTAHQILITSHGGFILSLVRALVAGRKVKLRKGVVVGRCLNSSVTVIEFGERMGGTLVKFGDVGHLKGALTVETNADETW